MNILPSETIEVIKDYLKSETPVVSVIGDGLRDYQYSTEEYAGDSRSETYCTNNEYWEWNHIYLLLILESEDE